MGVKSAARRAAAGAVSGLRLSSLISRAFGGRAAILAYHRVLDPALHDPDLVEPGLFVTRDSFAAHLELLARKYHVVPLETLVRRLLTGEEVARGTVVLTFDDGWLDTCQTAFPLLQRAGLPASIFVPTALIGTRHRFWFSRAGEAGARLWTLANQARDNGPALPPELAFAAALLRARLSRPAFVHRLLQACKDVSPTQRDGVVDRLEEAAGAPARPSRELVDWDELRRLAANVFEVGSHTASHVILTEVDAALAKVELEESRRTIAEQLGRPAVSLCYPNGDYNEGVRRLAKSCGFACALTTRAGFADPPLDLHALPRLGVHQGVAAKASGLELLLSGLFS